MTSCLLGSESLGKVLSGTGFERIAASPTALGSEVGLDGASRREERRGAVSVSLRELGTLLESVGKGLGEDRNRSGSSHHSFLRKARLPLPSERTPALVAFGFSLRSQQAPRNCGTRSGPQF